MKAPKIPFLPLLLKGALIILSLQYHPTTLRVEHCEVFPSDLTCSDIKHLLLNTKKCSSVIDITFIHEGNKTFHDNLVNFEKLVS